MFSCWVSFGYLSFLSQSRDMKVTVLETRQMHAGIGSSNPCNPAQDNWVSPYRMARRWTGGHSAPVLCVGAAAGPAMGPEGLLASGAEGGEVTVWSQEGAPLAQLRLRAGEDVTSAVFSSAAPGSLYASHGETVSELDPRNLKGPVRELRVGEDEINGLSLNETGTLLAAADDSGAVRVVELHSGKVSRTLRRHTNICSSVAFRPQRPHSLVSAGLDMQLMLWSLQRARPLWVLNLQEVAEEEEGCRQNPGQLFNPPLVHCVSAAACGNVLACAAEDGRVHVVRVGGGSGPERRTALQAHSQGASQAHFLSFLSHPHWLATGGNDGRVALWDVSELAAAAATEGKGKPRGPSRRRGGRGRAKPKAQAQAQAQAQPQPQPQPQAQAQPQPQPQAQPQPQPQAQAQAQQEDQDEEQGTSDEPGPETPPPAGPRLSISHGAKVNWLCPALLKGEPCLLVADQSSALSVYSLSAL
ncbi:WD repeat-containing protein 53 isoform X1 [Anguilla anguilla]|uniref:WD repeat-containing protein 53 isoform X1 n=3 Tax=Anguilla anguilla TaxID=7936 RepID=UPI0015AF8098|nr:WD repeat-containing protein 53 isoform X1 [Anguilla anguilla]